MPLASISRPGIVEIHQQNVKTSPGSSRGVMVPLVLLVHPDPPWSTFSVKFQKVWIRMDRSEPGGPQGPQPPLLDQERSGPLWTTLRHFPDASIPEQTYFEGYVSILVGAKGSKQTSTGAVLSFVLTLFNGFCSLSPHSQLPMHSFFVLAYSRQAVLLKPSINRR